MRIVLTGPIGAGKTTLCMKTLNIFESLNLKPCGFITYFEDRMREKLIIKDIATGKKDVLAVKSEKGGERVGKYLFLTEGIDFGVRAIERKKDVCFVDELGRLELNGMGFYRVFQQIRKFEDLVITSRCDFVDDVEKKLGVNLERYRIGGDMREDVFNILRKEIYREKGYPIM